MRKLNRRRLAVVIIVSLLVLLSGYWLAANVVIPYLFPSWVPEQDGDQAEDENPGRMNILVLGVDSRKGEAMARSDTILFVSADPKTQTASMLSIPRDSRVEIPGYGTDKINAATALGGPELAVETVSALIGQPIDYYVVTNFEGFAGIVDTLGGVTIDVEQRMYHFERDGYIIDLQKGVQRLDGEKALMYVRYRDYAMGDITRTEKQQKFLKALAQEMMQTKTITKLPRLVPELRKCIETDMSVREMARWAGVARKMDGLEIVSTTLPGYPADIQGISYWYVEPDLARDVAARLVRGEQVAGVNAPPPPESLVPRDPPQESEPDPETEPVLPDPGQDPGVETPPDDPGVIIVPGEDGQEPPPDWGDPPVEPPADEGDGGSGDGDSGGEDDWGLLPPL